MGRLTFWCSPPPPQLPEIPYSTSPPRTFISLITLVLLVSPGLYYGFFFDFRRTFADFHWISSFFLGFPCFPCIFQLVLAKPSFSYAFVCLFMVFHGFVHISFFVLVFPSSNHHTTPHHRRGRGENV